MSIDSRRTPGTGPGSRPDRFPLRLALTYGIVAAAWITISSTLVPDVAPAGMAAVVEVAKGVLFVMVTASLLYLLAWRFVRQRRRAEEALLASQARHRLLATAVEQAAEVVVITDPDGSIVYVNPAFERTYGYRRDEALGMNPRLLRSGRHGKPFYQAMWATITSGETWSGRLTNRRRDGGLVESEAVISPVRDDDGRIASFIGIQRDVTHELEVEQELERETRLRADLIEALDRLRALDGLDDIAAGICEEALALPEVDMAAVLSFTTPGVAVPIAVRVPPGIPIAPGHPLSPARAAYLRERASRGPWFETWTPTSVQGALGEALTGAGVQGLAFAPLRSGRRLLGLVAVASATPGGAADLARHLPQITEFASAAGTLLTPGLEADRRLGEVRDRVLAMVAARTFHPVFQPVIELGGQRVIGYEALTRFHDGMRPDHWFRNAQAVGLGIDLELGCLRSALEAATRLPADRLLGLNVSPELILAREPLRDLLAAARLGRRIVLEVTEHVAIDDYEALREALGTIGPNVELAVDDAGAGFASLRHIVELAPHFVKLDIGLVRDVDRDPARQALIAGMRHFAREIGCRLVGEGVETEAEAATLRELEVDLAQGYLYGWPVPVDELAEP